MMGAPPPGSPTTAPNRPTLNPEQSIFGESAALKDVNQDCLHLSVVSGVLGLALSVGIPEETSSLRFFSGPSGVNFLSRWVMGFKFRDLGLLGLRVWGRYIPFQNRSPRNLCLQLSLTCSFVGNVYWCCYNFTGGETADSGFVLEASSLGHCGTTGVQI